LWAEALAGILIEAPREHARVLRQDLGAALRVLRKNLVVTATIVITLALGIGANTAMFSLLNAVVLATLPVHAPEQLFTVRTPLVPNSRFSGPQFDRLRHAAPATTIAAMSRVARVYTRTAA